VGEISDGWEGGPGPNIVLGGPEPFAHPELPAIVAACKEAGVARIAVETDAAALSLSGNAEGALSSGVRHLLVRVLSGQDEVADRLSGRVGVASAARVGVASYLGGAERLGLTVAVTAVVPVCAHNLDMLPATVADLAARGFHAVRLITGGPLPSAASGIVAAACDTGMVNHLWVCTDGQLPLPPSHRLHGQADGAADD
ncbi:MAG: hypothetical protein JXA36_07650, partial [Coriobacteriia bacterium]|nr:hypothetical protein [Coriobacteriia bacterium]